MDAWTSDSRLTAIAGKFGTPCYVYDLCAFRNRIDEIRASFDVPSFHLLFASMANPREEFLRTAAELGVGACVNSLNHLSMAEDAGIDKNLIQFSSTGISSNDMTELRSRGIRVNLDSKLQVEQWFSISKEGRAGIRINAGSLNNALGDRIGIAAGKLDEVVSVAKSHGGEIEGLHVYVGTNFPSSDGMLPILERLFDLAKTVPSLDYVNIGGGVGVDYSGHSEFDLPRFGAAVSGLCRSLRVFFGREIHLFFEPGRSLAARSGVFLTSVTDIKELEGTRYVAVDGSVAVFPRPLHHPDSPHKVRLLLSADGGSGDQDDAVVVGRTTFSRDILAACRLPMATKVGDILAFDDAGAYCWSMASRFLGQSEPASICLGKDWPVI